MSEQFTVIGYQYADASGYKAYAEVALPGALTEEQTKPVRDLCDAEEFFLPEQVGLPALQGELLGYGGDGEDDHIWHTLVEIRVEDSASDATHQPTRPMTAAEFVAQFDGIVWDEQAAIASLDRLLGNY